MTTPANASPDTLTLYNYLPQFVRDNDAAGGYQFLSWLNGFISMGNDGDDGTLTYNYTYDDGVLTKLPVPLVVDNSPIPSAVGLQAIDDIIRDTPYSPGWSVLLDVGRCPTYALPWLAQFVGVRFPRPTTDAAMRKAIVNDCSTFRGTRSHIQWQLDQTTAGVNPIILERTAWDGIEYTYDPYAVTIVVNQSGLGAYTYGQIFADFSTYAAVESAFADYGAMYGNVGDLEVTALQNMPAGIFVYFNLIT